MPTRLGNKIRQAINGYLWYFQPKVPCPICNYPTLTEREGYDICYVCFWEDGGDVSDDDEPSGVNHGVSINQAKANFAQFGASDRRVIKHVEPYGSRTLKRKLTTGIW